VLGAEMTVRGGIVPSIRRTLQGRGRKYERLSSNQPRREQSSRFDAFRVSCDLASTDRGGEFRIPVCRVEVPESLYSYREPQESGVGVHRFVVYRVLAELTCPSRVATCL
jgi:hypothetical protein